MMLRGAPSLSARVRTYAHVVVVAGMRSCVRLRLHARWSLARTPALQPVACPLERQPDQSVKASAILATKSLGTGAPTEHDAAPAADQVATVAAPGIVGVGVGRRRDAVPWEWQRLRAKRGEQGHSSLPAAPVGLMGGRQTRPKSKVVKSLAGPTSASHPVTVGEAATALCCGVRRRVSIISQARWIGA